MQAVADDYCRRAREILDGVDMGPAARRDFGEILDFHTFVLSRYFSAETLDFQRVLEDLVAQGDRVQPLVADVSPPAEAVIV